MNRLSKNVAFTAGLMTLLAFHGSARADQQQSRPAQNLQQGSSSQAKPPAMEDYFAGLDYTAEQKAVEGFEPTPTGSLFGLARVSLKR